MDQDTDSTRRTCLKSITVGIVSTAGISKTAVAMRSPPKLPNEKQKRSLLKERFGSNLANIIIKSLKKHYGDYDSGKITKIEYHNRVTEELKKHPSSQPVAKKINKISDRIQSIHSKASADLEESVSKSSIETSTVEELMWDTASSNVNTYLLGTGKTEIIRWDLTKKPWKQKCKASSGLYGSAEARVRFETEFTPPSDGTYKIPQRYSRYCKAVAGGALFSIYVIDNDGFENKKTVEQLSQDADGIVKKYADFPLEGGKSVTVGFESLMSTTTGGGGGFGDFYSYGPGYQVYPDSVFEIEKY